MLSRASQPFFQQLHKKFQLAHRILLFLLILFSLDDSLSRKVGVSFFAPPRYPCSVLVFVRCIFGREFGTNQIDAYVVVSRSSVFA